MRNKKSTKKIIKKVIGIVLLILWAVYMVNNYFEERSKDDNDLVNNSRITAKMIAFRQLGLDFNYKNCVYDTIEKNEKWDFIRLMTVEDKEGDKWKIELRYGEDWYKEAIVYKNNKFYKEYRYVVVGVDKKTNEIHDWVETPKVSNSAK